jgi:cytidyltransferase-like protein
MSRKATPVFSRVYRGLIQAFHPFFREFPKISDYTYPEASVHGRFQPPHNGHLEYILTAKRQCEFLWIGITSYDIHNLHFIDVAPHRIERTANPLTYFERVQIITEMLVDAGVARSEFTCIPFPIEEPELLPTFLSNSIPCLITVYDQWGREKKKRLEHQGYKVDVLYERAVKDIEGRAIRDKIRLGVGDWEKMVPSATVKAILDLNLANRLAELARGDVHGL